MKLYDGFKVRLTRAYCCGAARVYHVTVCLRCLCSYASQFHVYNLVRVDLWSMEICDGNE